jgi:hypothetical protein
MLTLKSVPDPKFKGYLSLFKGEEFDVMSINASVWLVRDSAGIVGGTQLCQVQLIDIG